MISFKHYKKEVNSVISELALDLRGKTVITEAATGAYSVTAVIAALCGAEVFAYAKDSSYGSVEEVFAFMEQVTRDFGVDALNLIRQITPELLSKGDIITNSGHLRPLNVDKLKHLKSGAVVPVMYEKWELRDSDIDIQFCRQLGIKVGGTNERHSSIGVFNYLGDMLFKQLLDAGFCFKGKKFVLISNNDFGPFLAEALLKVSEGIGIIAPASDKERYGKGVVHLSDFPFVKSSNDFYDADALIFTAAPFNKTWIGKGCSIKPEVLKENFANPFLIRFAGDIGEEDCKNCGIPFYPQKVKSGHMGVIPSDIGWSPVIRLQAGGLKVAELMLKGETHYRDKLLVEVVN